MTASDNIGSKETYMASDLLVDHLRADFAFGQKEFEYIRPELDKRIFSCGLPAGFLGFVNKPSFSMRMRTHLSRLYTGIKILQPMKRSSGKNVLSSSYFTIDTELAKLGYSVNRAVWDYGRKMRTRPYPDFSLYKRINRLAKLMESARFDDLVRSAMVDDVKSLKNAISDSFEREAVDAFFCSSSYPPFNRMSIDVMAERGKPAFMFQHGLPGVYESHMKFYDGSYHLIVWGQRFKDKYVSLGMDPKRVHVSGHPYYQAIRHDDLRFDFQDVLVLSKSLPQTRVAKEIKLGDQSQVLLYLYSIKKTLVKLGIRSARLRLHPSENSTWYRRFLDTAFFRIDSDPLSVSMGKATLVIGPTSTTFLEGIYYGVNYSVYEPTVDGTRDLIDYPFAMPFDGSDDRIPVARNEDDLTRILKNRVMVDVRFWKDYIKTPFDLGPIKSLI